MAAVLRSSAASPCRLTHAGNGRSRHEGAAWLWRLQLAPGRVRGSLRPGRPALPRRLAWRCYCRHLRALYTTGAAHLWLLRVRAALSLPASCGTSRFTRGLPRAQNDTDRLRMQPALRRCDNRDPDVLRSADPAYMGGR